MNRLPFEPCEFFRVQLGSLYRELPQRSIFIESQTEKAARMRVANAISGLEFRTVLEVMGRIIDVKSAHQCIEEGRHEDEALRIFEVAHTESLRRVRSEAVCSLLYRACLATSNGVSSSP
jgi:hypothetical protein